MYKLLAIIFAIGYPSVCFAPAFTIMVVFA